MNRLAGERGRGKGDAEPGIAAAERLTEGYELGKLDCISSL
jgi:hypothetical protein